MPTLDWIGKDKVINHHMDVPYRVLNRVYSYDLNGRHSEDNGSENKIIHGDNLEALKSFKKGILGRKAGMSAPRHGSCRDLTAPI